MSDVIRARVPLVMSSGLSISMGTPWRTLAGIQNLDAYSYFCEQVAVPHLDEQRTIAAFSISIVRILNPVR